MKIYQITQVSTYYNSPNNKQNSQNSIYSFAVPAQHQVSFSCRSPKFIKSIVSFGSNIKKRAGRMWNDSISYIEKKADNFEKKYITPLYKSFNNRINNTRDPQKVEKVVVPASKKVPNSPVPVPNFSMDYEKILNDLKTIKKIDSKWVKENTPVLKAAIGYKDEKMSQSFFESLAGDINSHRDVYINDVKNLQKEEKAAYINSIWDEFIYVNPPYKPGDKKKNIQGLKALQKYGTVEDLRKLPAKYRISKDSEIMKEYAKLVGIVGEVPDSITLMAKVDKDGLKIYSEETMAEIMKSLKKLMVDKAAPKTWVNFDNMQYMEFERILNHPNPEISENAKAIMRRLEEENRWLLE